MKKKQVNLKGITDIVGMNYTAEKLHPIERRMLESLRPAKERQPAVWRIVGEGGMQYKLLTAERSNTNKLAKISKQQQIYENLPFVPKILIANQTHVLCKYVEGKRPNTSSREFAYKLGRNLARVNEIGISDISSSSMEHSIEQWLEILHREKLLSEVSIRNLRVKLKELMPQRVRTCLDYIDISNKNVIEGSDKELYFIDLGGFSFDCLPAECVYSGKVISERLDKEGFEEGYKEAGGQAFYFYNKEFIVLVAALKNCARYVRIMEKRPRYQLRHRRAWKKAIGRTLEDLRNVTEQETGGGS